MQIELAISSAINITKSGFYHEKVIKPAIYGELVINV